MKPHQTRTARNLGAQTVPASQTTSEHAGTPRRNKYGARRVEADGYVFDSIAERRRFGILKIRQQLGEISMLTVHPSWSLDVNGHHIGRATLDFFYQERGVPVYEDVKSAPTRRAEGWRYRKKLLKALYGIEVQEIEA